MYPVHRIFSWDSLVSNLPFTWVTWLDNLIPCYLATCHIPEVFGQLSSTQNQWDAEHSHNATGKPHPILQHKHFNQNFLGWKLPSLLWCKHYQTVDLGYQEIAPPDWYRKPRSIDKKRVVHGWQKSQGKIHHGSISGHFGLTWCSSLVYLIHNGY